MDPFHRFCPILARCDFTEAIRLDPNFTSAYSSRGETYRKKGQYDAVISDCNEAVRLDLNNTWAYGICGRVYKQLGQKNQAIQDFEKALNLDANLDWVKQELEEIR
jgi:tetratricopeptide (TPR) repeat protein